MAAITWADVTNFAPRTPTTHADMQAAILAYVNTSIKVTNFALGEASAKLKLARLNLAAHMAMVGPSSGNVNVGNVSSSSAGGLSLSYVAGGVAVEASSLGSTLYGQEYLRLIRTSGARVGFNV